jgi:hypothetical protein
VVVLHSGYYCYINEKNKCIFQNIHGILGLRKDGITMPAPNPQIIIDKEDAAKLELYRLIGEGVRAVQEGRTSTFKEVKDRIEKRRAEKNG